MKNEHGAPDSRAAWEAYKRTMVRPADLYTAAKDDDIELIERLLAGGANIDARDARGYSPLMLATYAGNQRAVECLLENGADPNSSDAAGNTVLMGAAFKGHTDMVETLVYAGADPGARNHSGMNAIELATLFGRADVVELIQRLCGSNLARREEAS